MRQRREQQEIDLIAIAEQTKIKLSLLQALERDDVSHWPAGIFRRAFVRAYAHAIGLNPDVVVREFLEVHPDPIEVVATTSAISSAVDASRGNSNPPTRLRNLVGSAIGSLSRLRRLSSPDDVPSVGRPLEGKPAPTVLYDPDVVLRYEPPPPEPESPALETLPELEPPAPELWPDRIHLDERAAPPARMDAAAATPVERTPVPDAPSWQPDLLAAAQLCTELGRVEHADDVQLLLQEASRILDGIGLIIWVWDPQAEILRAVLASGYSDKVLAQLPNVRRDADNATAAAFRLVQPCTINGGPHTSGALAVPLLTPGGCAGVLAIELQNGNERTTSVRAIATIIAAQLAQLIGDGRSHDEELGPAERELHEVRPGPSPAQTAVR
ncbi:MAG: helix-turn-helix domain-containing protein [Acidobacteriota bacterium]